MARKTKQTKNAVEKYGEAFVKAFPPKKRTRAKLDNGEYLNDTWATPWPFMASLRMSGYKFDCDVCASELNAKAEYYIDRETDALSSVSWTVLMNNAGVKTPRNGFTFFCNPGYSNVLPWCEKAHYEAQKNNATTCILAHDNFCGPWFRYAYRKNARILLLYPRIQFLPPAGVKKSTNMRCSILLVFRRGPQYPTIDFVDWSAWISTLTQPKHLIKLQS